MEQKTLKKLSVGWIPYWNLRPLKYELDRMYSGSLDFKVGVPAQVNSWMRNGEVDIAPCSSICLAQSKEMEIALPLGVAANGPVLSVYLGLHQEHGEIMPLIYERRLQLKEIFMSLLRSTTQFSAREFVDELVHQSKNFSTLPLSTIPGLKLSRESETSAVLASCFYKLWFGNDAYDLMVKRDISREVYTKRPMELIIGDSALQKRHNFKYILDLGGLWKEMTGMPFVYAVWQSRGTCINGWRRRIFELGQIAENRMKIDPTTYFPKRMPVDEQGREIPLSEYWKTIYFQLGKQEIRSLTAYLCLARNLGLVKKVDEVVGKILRWQDLCNQSYVI